LLPARAAGRLGVGEFRFRDGNSLWFNYGLLGSWQYNPSEGLLLKFSGDLVYLVLIRGSNLDKPLSEGRSTSRTPGFNGTASLLDSGDDPGEIARVGETGPTIDSIEVGEFATLEERREWLKQKAPAFLRERTDTATGFTACGFSCEDTACVDKENEVEFPYMTTVNKSTQSIDSRILARIRGRGNGFRARSGRFFWISGAARRSIWPCTGSPARAPSAAWPAASTTSRSGHPVLGLLVPARRHHRPVPWRDGTGPSFNPPGPTPPTPSGCPSRCRPRRCS